MAHPPVIRWWTSLLAPVALAAFASPVLAHTEAPSNFAELKSAWEFDPGVIIPLALSAWLYFQGLWNLWRPSGVGHGVPVWKPLCFLCGWLTLVLALVSPLHPWGRVLFSAHMAQHEILMLVSAPLIVLGHPAAVMLHALPASLSKRIGRWSNGRGWRSVWTLLSNALVAWLIHGIALWIWHAPALMQGAIEHDWVHALQHLSFLLSALLFWWAVIHGPQRALGYGMSVLYLFTTALHSGLLGVLLTFALTIWYPSYAHSTQPWGLEPLEDQQLVGLIMWIPAGVVYIIAGVALLAGWMREAEIRQQRRESAARSVLLAKPVEASL